jgi:hypothetical protein
MARIYSRLQCSGIEEVGVGRWKNRRNETIHFGVGEVEEVGNEGIS